MKPIANPTTTKNPGNRYLGAWLITSVLLSIACGKFAGMVLLICFTLVLWKQMARFITNHTFKSEDGSPGGWTWQRGCLLAGGTAVTMIGILSL